MTNTSRRGANIRRQGFLLQLSHHLQTRHTASICLVPSLVSGAGWRQVSLETSMTVSLPTVPSFLPVPVKGPGATGTRLPGVLASQDGGRSCLGAASFPVWERLCSLESLARVGEGERTRVREDSRRTERGDVHCFLGEALAAVRFPCLQRGIDWLLQVADQPCEPSSFHRIKSGCGF